MIDVQPSPIHGKGVFATEKIRRDEFIGRYVSRRTKRDGTYVMWLEDKKNAGKFKGYDGYGRLRFLNHSGQPNAEFEGLDLFALKNIRPGEEITFHYGDEWEDID